MKKFFRNLLAKKPQKPHKIQDCHNHDHIRFPNIKSMENCMDCNFQMCYMCGSHHIERKCTVNCT